MSATGWYLLICKCDECGEEKLYRGENLDATTQKATRSGWKMQGGKLLCLKCAKVVVCRFCRGKGCIACQGEKDKAKRTAGMRLLK